MFLDDRLPCGAPAQVMPPLDPSILVDHIKAQGRRERKNPGSDNGGVSSLWTLDPHERLLKMSLQKEQVFRCSPRRTRLPVKKGFVQWNTLVGLFNSRGGVFQSVPIAQVVPKQVMDAPEGIDWPFTLSIVPLSAPDWLVPYAIKSCSVGRRRQTTRDKKGLTQTWTRQDLPEPQHTILITVASMPSR